MKEDTGWKYLTYRGTWIRILLAFVSGIMKQKSSRGRYLKCWEKKYRICIQWNYLSKVQEKCRFFQTNTEEFSSVDLPYKKMLRTTTTKVCQIETKLYMWNLNVYKERKSIKWVGKKDKVKYFDFHIPNWSNR